MSRRVAADWTVSLSRSHAAVLSEGVGLLMSIGGARPDDEIEAIEALCERLDTAAAAGVTPKRPDLIELHLSSPEIVLLREAARVQVRSADRWPEGDRATGLFYKRVLVELPDTSDIVSAIGSLDGPRVIALR